MLHGASGEQRDIYIMSDLECPAKVLLLNSADSGQTSKTPEWGCIPTGIVHGDINLVITQKKDDTRSRYQKHQAPRLGLE